MRGLGVSSDVICCHGAWWLARGAGGRQRGAVGPGQGCLGYEDLFRAEHRTPVSTHGDLEPHGHGELLNSKRFGASCFTPRAPARQLAA